MKLTFHISNVLQRVFKQEMVNAFLLNRSKNCTGGCILITVATSLNNLERKSVWNFRKLKKSNYIYASYLEINEAALDSTSLLQAWDSLRPRGRPSQAAQVWLKFSKPTPPHAKLMSWNKSQNKHPELIKFSKYLPFSRHATLLYNTTFTTVQGGGTGGPIKELINFRQFTLTDIIWFSKILFWK